MFYHLYTYHMRKMNETSDYNTKAGLKKHIMMIEREMKRRTAAKEARLPGAEDVG